MARNRQKKEWKDMSLKERKVSFKQHFRVYLVMCVFFFGVNAASSFGNWWFYWPMLGWGIGVAIQGLSLFGPLADNEEELSGNEWDTHGLPAPESERESLELPELDKRYRDDELV